MEARKQPELVAKMESFGYAVSESMVHQGQDPYNKGPDIRDPDNCAEIIMRKVTIRVRVRVRVRVSAEIIMRKVTHLTTPASPRVFVAFVA